jgi:hypothetical protein
MEKIKIYRINCTEAYMADECGIRFALRPWTGNTIHYKGDDDGGMDYLLPDGLHLDIGNDELPHIYADDGTCCDLVTHVSGHPQVAVSLEYMPVLQLA